MKLETTTECKSMVKTENEFESKDKNKLGPTKKETDDSERNKFDEIVKDGSGIEIQLLAPDTHVIKEVESNGEVAEEEAVVNSAIPIDRGWAWMVLLALFVMTVGMKFLSGRKIQMIASTILCVSYVISSRAEDVRLLLFSHGVLQGIGMASMDPISITMLSNYFEKRRGFANSMANSGGSLGGLIFAPLLTAMFDYYGYSGAMLLVGAFLLHGFIGAALFRSQSFYTKRYQQTTRKRKPNKLDTRADPLGDESKALIKNGYTIVRSDRERQREQVSGSLPTSVCSDREQWISVQLSEASENHTITSLPNLAPHAKPLRRRTETEPSDGYVMDRITELREIRTSDYIGGSQFSIPVVINLDNHASSHDNKETKGYLSCFNYFSKLFDFSLFRNPVFITYLFGAGLLCTPHALTMMYIAPHAKEMGADSAGVAKVLTIYSAVDLCSRIIVAFISDRKWIRRSTMIAISSCTTGIMAHLMVFFTSYNWFLFYAVVFGVIGGVYFSLYPVVIVDYLTLEKLQRCLGFTILFQAIFVSGASAIIGMLRDNTGSYIASFHVLGTMALLGGSLMGVLPLVERCYYGTNRPGNVT